MRLLTNTARAVALVLVSAPAAAQSATSAAAESLFQEGRVLLDAGRYEEGCPKLAESQRLEPATGTLLALAVCHEGQGRLASAWAEFVEAEGRSRRDAREDRRALARERATALRPRLSTLTVVVPEDVAATPGLEVRVDGSVIGSASFGVALPVDGGEHRVEITATGRRRFATVVPVNVERDSVRVSVPPLAPLEAPSAAPQRVSASSDTSDSASRTESKSTLRDAGLVTAGAGVVVLGIGTYLAFDAKSDYAKAKGDCAGNACTQEPYDETQRARSQGTVATVLIVASGAAVATGAALWFLAPRAPERQAASATRFRVERVGLGPRGFTLRGRF